MQICKFNFNHVQGDGITHLEVYLHPDKIVQMNAASSDRTKGTVVITVGHYGDDHIHITQELTQATTQWQNCLQGIN